MQPGSTGTRPSPARRRGGFSRRSAVLAATFLGAGLIVGGLAHVVTRDLVASWTGMGLNPFRPQPGAPGASDQPGPTPTISLAVTP
ncbi:MAG TPA: hypothetical protein VGA32_07530, partial [Anaerolineales bacterium]